MMTMVISGSDGVTFPDSTNQFSGGAFSFKNRIINGDMRIDQRNAGAAVTLTADLFVVDRFYARTQSATNSTAQRSTTAPSGFNNSLLVTIGTGASPSSSATNAIRQEIEGFNVADLGWGTASAKTVTISFWVRSSLTGTFGGALSNAGLNRAYPYTYSISSANTWEYKTITIPGDTSGTWATDNSSGIRFWVDLGTGTDRQGTAGSWAAADYRAASGCVQLVATTGATLNITGVQLEVGSVATPFERRPFGTELALCQRYFQRNVFVENDYPFSSGYAYANNTVAGYLPLSVAMRAQPTATIVGTMGVRGGGLGNQSLTSLGFIYYSVGASVIMCNPTTSATNLTISTVYLIANAAGSSGFTLSAEL
jgi:hypothetical protein